VPVLLDGVGSQNYWYRPRHESGKGPWGIVKGNPANVNAGSCNEVDMGYAAGTDASYRFIWLQVAGAYANIYRYGKQANEHAWNSGPMVGKLSSGGAATVGRIAPPFFCMQGTDGAPLRSTNALGRAVTNTKALQLALGFGVFVEVNTERVKDFTVSAGVLPGFGGRLYVVALDQNGAILNGTVTDSWGTENYVKFFGVTAASNFGGSFTVGSDNTSDNVRLTVREDVKAIRIGFAPATNALALLSFEIVGHSRMSDASSLTLRYDGMGITSPVMDIHEGLIATANPATAGVYGKYTRGALVGNASAASAQPAGWECTAPAVSWLAAAWVAATAYAVPGHVVTNDTGKVYELLTAGTSAGAGGPTGTGTATAWAISTAYVVGAYVSQSGLIYKCTTAGTSAASGGPAGGTTGRRASITDGTCVWTFMGTSIPIADGTCTWGYVGTLATFAALPNLV
jgi:hypothetical protein